MNDQPEMLDLVKALAHVDRLRIVGLLVQAPTCLSKISESLSLPVGSVFNHLEFLKFVGVVHEKAGLYELDTDGLEILARRQFDGTPPAGTPGSGPIPARQKVLSAFLYADGSLRQIPNSITQKSKFHLVLEYLQAAFDPGLQYTEKEVNTILRRFHIDVSGLRRDLVDANMLGRERDGSRYWRIDEGAAK